jgi:uncharacterized C2H2 Zn-finger protein
MPMIFAIAVRNTHTLTLPLGRGKMLNMEAMRNKVNDYQGAKPRAVCPKCGATFMDRRGLNGHMAGKHGSKWGLNATVDSLVKEVQELSARIDILIEVISKGDVVGKRLVELANKLAQKPWEVCGDVEMDVARREFELLKGIRAK